MTRFVIDAPTLLHLVTEPVAVAPEHRLVAPNALRSQALDLLWAAVRRGELDDGTARDRHEAMTGLKVRLLGDRVSRWTAWRMAAEHGFETPSQAEYLAVTALQGDAYVTVDPVARERATGVVPVAEVGDLTRP